MSVKPHLQHLRRLTLVAPTAFSLLWASSTMAQAAEHAHHTSPPPNPDPARPRQVELPRAPDSVAYESVFTRYRSLRDQPPTDWTAANRTVNNLGGWRAYAREAQRDGADKSPNGAHQQHGGRP